MPNIALGEQKPLTVFVTGATGFLGSHLCVKLLAAGHHLILLVRPQATDPTTRVQQAFIEASQASKPLDGWERIKIIVGDITKPKLGLNSEALGLLRKEAQAVFHCAASVSFEDHRKAMEQCNIVGTRNVIDLLGLLQHPTLHYVSTAYVSGAYEGQAVEETIRQRQPFNNLYEETKFTAEQSVLDYRVLHPQTTIYRPSIIVGRLSDGHTTSFKGFYRFLAMFDSFFRQVQTRATHAAFLRRFVGIEQRNGVLHIPMRVPGRLSKTLNLVPIDFVVEGIMAVFSNKAAYGKIYHLVNPAPPTLAELKHVIDRLYHLSGIELVDPASFSISRPTTLESLFLTATHRYIFYLQNPEPKFDDTNSRRILEPHGLRCPRLDQPAIERIIDFARRSSWGKQAR